LPPATGRLEPDGNGGYFEFDENDTPLGHWTKDPDGNWVFEEFPVPGGPADGKGDVPTPEKVPKTGDWIWVPILLLILSGLLMVFLVWTRGRRKNGQR
jgi:hypothetical protein